MSWMAKGSGRAPGSLSAVGTTGRVERQRSRNRVTGTMMRCSKSCSRSPRRRKDRPELESWHPSWVWTRRGTSSRSRPGGMILSSRLHHPSACHRQDRIGDPTGFQKPLYRIM